MRLASPAYRWVDAVLALLVARAARVRRRWRRAAHRMHPRGLAAPTGRPDRLDVARSLRRGCTRGRRRGCARALRRVSRACQDASARSAWSLSVSDRTRGVPRARQHALHQARRRFRARGSGAGAGASADVDHLSRLFGGEKVRKLELYFGEARALEKRRILSFGGVGSNQALAVAVLGSALGFSVRLDPPGRGSGPLPFWNTMSSRAAAIADVPAAFRRFAR